MAVTVNTHSKPIGWSRSDVIDQLEEAHTTVGAHMGPVTGLVGGVKSWTYGGVNTQRSSYSEWDYYYDVEPSSWTGSGTGATFEVGVYQGKVRYIQVNRQGSGYASGDVLTLNDLDFGGNGSNGVQDINVTIYVEGYATGGTTYELGYDSSNDLSGVDANGAINATDKDVAANITIAEGDTLILRGLDGYSNYTYILWNDFSTNTLGNTIYTGALNSQFDFFNFKPENVVNQGARYWNSVNDDNYIKWKPSPGQAGTYYIRSTGTSCVHTITVVAAATSNSVVKTYGATNAFFDKQNRQSGLSPWGVCRREVESNKKYGITYQAYQFEDDTNGRTELSIATGSSYRPQTSTLPDSYTINGNSRTPHGKGYDYTNDLSTTQDDLAYDMYDRRFKGEVHWDIPYTPNHDNISLNDSTSTNSPVINYGSMRYDDHGMRIADYNAYNSYSLDLITYQSGIDPNFVVFSFKQPNLSSTQLRDNSFMTWFIHDYTSPGLFDYNDLWLGGVTLIAAASDGSTDLDYPYIRFRSFMAGQHQGNTDQFLSKRSAECGFIPYKSVSLNGYGEGTPYFDTIYGTSSLTTKEGQNDYVSLYYRTNLSHTNRGIGGDNGIKSTSNTNVGTAYAAQQLPDSTNFNAVIKGLPLSVKIAPVPYYLPNDFAMIDFDVSTPQANIQQGDTITVSGTEVYTIITGSYNQTTRTRGILFCARTT
mgnify:FL=1